MHHDARIGLAGFSLASLMPIFHNRFWSIQARNDTVIIHNIVLHNSSICSMKYKTIDTILVLTRIELELKAVLLVNQVASSECPLHHRYVWILPRRQQQTQQRKTTTYSSISH